MIATIWRGAAEALGRVRKAVRSAREAEQVRLFNLLACERGVATLRGLRYGPGARQTFDLYQAHPLRARKMNGAVALFLPGGGWIDCGRETYRFVGTALAARGVTTLVADYRLYPEARFPDFMEDAARAWGAACSRAEGRPVLLMGHSAGAHMAALLALDPRYRARFAAGAPEPAGLIGLAGPYAFDPTTWPSTRAIFAAAADHPDVARPVAHVRARVPPPSLLLYGLADATVGRANGLEFSRALVRAGGRARLIEYADIGHVGIAAALGRGWRWRAPVLPDVLRFIDEITAPARSTA